MKADYPLSTRRNLLTGSAMLLLIVMLPRRSFAEKGKPMLAPSTPFNGKVATRENLQEFGLLGLQHTDPAAGWQRISFGNNVVHGFSAAHPNGIELSEDALLTAAEIGLAKAHPTYAGRSLQAACDGYGMIGAYVV
jgi:hypothetical protein